MRALCTLALVALATSCTKPPADPTPETPAPTTSPVEPAPIADPPDEPEAPVPETPTPEPDPAPVAEEPCGDAVCKAPEKCMTVVGMRPGSARKECWVPCGEDDKCPEGMSCTMIHDGPGRVCQ